MRLRRKPWVDEAIHEFDDFVVSRDQEIGEEKKGKWAEIFGRQAPLHVELGTGKGDFISQLAERHPENNYIGIEMQQDVLYSAAKKVAEKELKNVRLLVFDINHIEDIFAPGEVDRFYINFCDPWPKKRHAKRRLTHVGFSRNIVSFSRKAESCTSRRTIVRSLIFRWNSLKKPACASRMSPSICTRKIVRTIS